MLGRGGENERPVESRGRTFWLCFWGGRGLGQGGYGVSLQVEEGGFIDRVWC